MEIVAQDPLNPRALTLRLTVAADLWAARDGAPQGELDQERDVVVHYRRLGKKTLKMLLAQHGPMKFERAILRLAIVEFDAPEWCRDFATLYRCIIDGAQAQLLEAIGVYSPAPGARSAAEDADIDEDYEDDEGIVHVVAWPDYFNWRKRLIARLQAAPRSPAPRPRDRAPRSRGSRTARRTVAAGTDPPADDAPGDPSAPRTADELKRRAAEATFDYLRRNRGAR